MMLDHGEVKSGIDLMVNRGDWSQALDVAQKHGNEVLNHYIIRYLKSCFDSGKFGEALGALAHYGMPHSSAAIPLYKKLIDEVFATCEHDKISDLRTALYGYMNELADSERTSRDGRQFEKFLLVAHQINMKYQYSRKGQDNMVAKTAISLVRYIDITSLDKPFQDAGQSCRQNNLEDIAFVFLNRYLDIYYVIDDPQNNPIEEVDEFKITDIPSLYDLQQPAKNIASEDEQSNFF